jgi:hypothetical protein
MLYGCGGAESSLFDEDGSGGSAVGDAGGTTGAGAGEANGGSGHGGAGSGGVGNGGQSSGPGGGGSGGDPMVCGDAVCDPIEDCDTCASDCGDCPCEGPDCEGPVCGDGSCDVVEDCATCALDCGVCPPVCGDLVCEGGETCSSCSSDCGTCAPVCGDGVCEPNESCLADCGCSAHSDCGSSQICYQSSCESAYGRNYLFTVVDAYFPTNKPSDGQPWDVVGPPDPFVELCTQAACPAQTTTTKDNVYSAVWNESFVVMLSGPSTGSVSFRMWDEDFNLHDLALQTPIGIPSQWVDIVRNQGGMYLYSPSAGLDVQIAVQPQ